ncbi:transport and Golgi organization protein 6-like protein [Platysternon megacephalum]|uniref:Transport and Golgi organization protein 6-like protein n=1 Tax=Platysternon megacephalum TaxID=55544 RepID=A0A4D9EAW3_9SAUR|nr:transport and Golgi organization protein 6-like protein [Platysternon megacephalum]
MMQRAKTLIQRLFAPAASPSPFSLKQRPPGGSKVAAPPYGKGGRCLQEGVSAAKSAGIEWGLVPTRNPGHVRWLCEHEGMRKLWSSSRDVWSPPRAECGPG